MGFTDDFVSKEVIITSLSERTELTLAEVTNINDQEGFNRVRCKPLTLDDDDKEGNWAYVCSFMSGNNSGAFFHPNVGDIVLLGYLDGNAHTPVVIGRVWVNTSNPPYKINEGKNDIYSIKTKSGAELLIDETQGKEKISITTKTGTSVLLDDGNSTISIKDKGGSNALTMDLGKGETTLKASRKLTLQAGSAAKVVIDGMQGKIDINGPSNVSLSSARIKADATADCTISGKAKLSAESAGVTIVKGSIVKIN